MIVPADPMSNPDQSAGMPPLHVPMMRTPLPMPGALLLLIPLVALSGLVLDRSYHPLVQRPEPVVWVVVWERLVVAVLVVLAVLVDSRGYPLLEVGVPG